jgi:biotin carboxyl carrier protein
VPESASRNPQPRSPEERAADHLAVERLAVDLLPALIGKLQATGLAELEVREAGWKVRLRRPLEVAATGRRSTDRHLRLPVPGGAPAPGGSPAPRDPGATRPAGGPTRTEDPADAPSATSPAVGIFRPLAGIVGRRVRSGDRLGSVDMLGIAQEIVAPADGLVGPLLAEAGDGVEYGQPLLEMRPLPVEPAARPAIERGASPAAEPATEPASGTAVDARPAGARAARPAADRA